MCTCVKRITGGVLDKVKEKTPGRKVIEIDDFEGDGLANRAYSLGSGEGIRMYTPFTYRYTFTRVNGIESKVKKETVNIFHSFCPFCGIEINPTS